jgi:hypothetical protein
MKYHVRVYDADGLHWTETFATDDFDDALAEWAAECKENPTGSTFSGRVELVEENILEVQEP